MGGPGAGGRGGAGVQKKVFGKGEVRVLCERREIVDQMSSVHVAEVADWLVLHDAQVVHGAAEGDLDSLADAGCATLHHFDFVYGLVHAQRNHLGSRKPLPEGGKVSIYYTTPAQQQGSDV